MPYMRVCLFLCMCLWMSAPSSQSSRQDSPWESFGIFEVQWIAEEQATIVRMVRFSNGEFMGEIESKGIKKQVLQVIPSGLMLYSGLSEDESPRIGGNNPFSHVDLAFAHPGMALHAAYPSGAKSVPSARVEKEVLLENKYPARIAANRDTQGRVWFELSLRYDGSKPKEKWTAQGMWDGKRQDPFPDDMPLTQWQYDSSANVATLREARALSRDLLHRR